MIRYVAKAEHQYRLHTQSPQTGQTDESRFKSDRNIGTMKA